MSRAFECFLLTPPLGRSGHTLGAQAQADVVDILRHDEVGQAGLPRAFQARFDQSSNPSMNTAFGKV